MVPEAYWSLFGGFFCIIVWMLKKELRTLLSVSENKIFQKLNSPKKIQDFLDSLPINFETSGETYMSPRRVLTAGTAHCFEGALLAAAALGYHGQKPLLMDFQTGYDDEDHVVALFRHNGLWGAISKTNHAVLRYRDAVYQTPRELAMSYFHEYFMWDGRKSLRAYSKPYDLSRFSLKKWVTASEELFWLAQGIDGSRHFPVVRKKNISALRVASKIELDNLRFVEWKSVGKKSKKV